MNTIKREKEQAMLMKLEDDFFDTLFKIHTSYKDTDDTQKCKLINKAKCLAKEIPYLKDWPNGSIFWDIESGMWRYNIDEIVRESIKAKITKIIGCKKNNLSLGSGNYPYVDGSVMLDYSKGMLESFKGKNKKVLFDLGSGKRFSFKDDHFDSCTMIFVTNYIKDTLPVFKEVYRVLKDKGIFVIVNKKGYISELYKEQEKKHHSIQSLKSQLKSIGFDTKALNYNFKGISFYFLRSQKSYSKHF